MPPYKTGQLNKDDLLGLYKHFESSIRNELGFVFQYFNFYIGLLSAIAAGTLTGILNLDTKDLRGLILLSGPVAMAALSLLGYSSIKVYYHRFTEAWITKINIESILALQIDKNLEKGLNKPLYPSENGGFITQVDNALLKETFDLALKESWNAEQLSNQLVNIGFTLRHAKRTFVCFCLLGVVLAIANMLVMFF